MTYIVCVCNACGKTFIVLYFITKDCHGRYVHCPHCESKDVQETDVLSNRVSKICLSKSYETPCLPLMILDFEGTLTPKKLTDMIDKHKAKYDRLPLYIVFSKELFDRFNEYVSPPMSETRVFKYCGSPIKVEVKD